MDKEINWIFVNKSTIDEFEIIEGFIDTVIDDYWLIIQQSSRLIYVILF